MKLKTKETITAYLFILPSLIGIVVFYIIPYIICFIKSMYIGNRFVGIENYILLFQNSTFLLALKNTAIFSLTAIPLTMIISFLLALFLNSFKGISAFFRSSLLIPVIVPIASLICVWQVIFDDYGAINSLLNQLGFSPINFFNSEFSMIMIILIYIWKHCGFCVILFTAGLANVNHHLYESGKLDGANSLQLVTKITIPLITPTTFFVFLMEIIYSLKISREVFALFGNYPNKNVYFLQNFINNNYYNLNYPHLSSASIILSVMITGTVLLFFMFERKNNYSH
ncbi:MAG: carbohydrate ABC transporter permease [Ruminococcus sp.]